MKLHPRTLPVKKAGRELAAFIDDWAQRHDLTIAEGDEE